VKAYKFLNLKYGLKAIQERRIKISQLKDLNDPFEGLPFDLSIAYHRDVLARSLDEIGPKYGYLCFSAKWCNPVLWAHYADKHHGLCLGFDTKFDLAPVSYIPNRIPFVVPPTLTMAELVHSGKSADWRYEDELRAITTLETQSGGLYFMEFNERMRLADVIIGVRCALTKQRVIKALGNISDRVAIRKARLAYDTFDIVEDEGAFG